MFVLELEKKNNQWELKKKISYLQNMFFFFFKFGPLLLSKLITFSFLLHFKWFKVMRECHLKLPTNNLGTVIIIEQHTKNFLGVQELVVVCCFEFLTPCTLVGRNFLNSNFFLTILSASNVPRGGVQHFLGH
jgi:hypothetical protein